MTATRIVEGTHAGRTVVAIEGELDISAVPQVAGALERALAAAPTAPVIDLSATTFLDSAGINLLYDVSRGFAPRGWRVHIVVPPANLIRRTLELTGADRSFAVHADLDEALQQTAASSPE